MSWRSDWTHAIVTGRQQAPGPRAAHFQNIVVQRGERGSVAHTDEGDVVLHEKMKALHGERV